jgi:hypothetical protein
MRVGISRHSLFLIVMLIPAVLVAQDPRDSDDFTAYVEQIRKWGMTEDARGSIRMIASVEAGTTLLSYQKDDSSGAYWTRYTSTSCPKPDMSETERQELRDELEARIAPLMEKLRPVADMDNSGFVTTEEGAQFRAIVEFGYKASHVLTEEDRDLKKTCAGLSMNEDRFREQVKQYKELLVKAWAAGLELPDLEI